MKHLKKFDTKQEYLAYINGGSVVIPNVCYIKETNEVLFNGELPENVQSNMFFSLGIDNAALNYVFEKDLGYSEIVLGKYDSGDIEKFSNDPELVFAPKVALKADSSYMYDNCQNLTLIPELEASNVENMNNFGSKNPKLKYVGNLNSSNTKLMDNMFSDCVSLKNVSLDMSNATSVTKIFSNCPNLNVIKISNLGKGSAKMYDFSDASKWGTGGIDAFESLVDSLVNFSYDRKTNGMPEAIIKIAKETKDLLSGKNIADMMRKGYVFYDEAVVFTPEVTKENTNSFTIKLPYSFESFNTQCDPWYNDMFISYYTSGGYIETKWAKTNAKVTIVDDRTINVVWDKFDFVQGNSYTFGIPKGYIVTASGATNEAFNMEFTLPLINFTPVVTTAQGESGNVSADNIKTMILEFPRPLESFDGENVCLKKQFGSVWYDYAATGTISEDRLSMTIVWDFAPEVGKVYTLTLPEGCIVLEGDAKNYYTEVAFTVTE